MIEDNEIKLELDGMLFTWDDEKEKINIRKHGVRFSVAATAFLDYDAVIRHNSFDDVTGEERFDIIALVAGNIIMFVVYVSRENINNRDVTRIISARKATRQEEKIYDNGYE